MHQYFTIRISSIHITISNISIFLKCVLCRDKNNADSDVWEFKIASEPLELDAWSMARFNGSKLCMAISLIIYLKQRACVLAQQLKQKRRFVFLSRPTVIY